MKLRLLAQGFAASSEGETHKAITEAYTAAVASIFPHLSMPEETKDKNLIDKMEKEVSKGALFFSPVSMSTTKASIKKMQISDTFKKSKRKNT